MMDRQKKNELPRMQVQFFDNVGIPIFRVSDFKVVQYTVTSFSERQKLCISFFNEHAFTCPYDCRTRLTSHSAFVGVGAQGTVEMPETVVVDVDKSVHLCNYIVIRLESSCLLLFCLFLKL